ncbi:helix-turn-helix transcriptional regulator [Paenibacillus ehimensis]|uniref:helix-turn-helix transcriptional regulator n=1 Tax=Paenibacillus ehimensis TaxID=79264 RepID=UPI0004712890|nr:YafY family protein [Paenibacillus ehimensis]
MNKTDRLLAIVIELQRKGVLRAEDLAARFETSTRTIYRDIQALSEAGVPVVGAPGQGYSLMEGYFLPPVSFTVEEAVALLIGTDFVEQKFDARYGAKAQSARGKIEAVLPESVRSEASRVRATMRLLAAGEAPIGGPEKQYLEALRQAILEQRKVRFRYSKNRPEIDRDRHSDRTVAPYGLILVRGSWILIAHCELRQELRHFRLSRMSGLAVLEDPFSFPPDFQLQDYLPADDRNVYVRILASPVIVDRVKETCGFYLEAFEDRKEGLVITFRVRQPEELLHWVLGWGANVVVLEPEALKIRVRQEAEKMLKRY